MAPFNDPSTSLDYAIGKFTLLNEMMDMCRYLDLQLTHILTPVSRNVAVHG